MVSHSFKFIDRPNSPIPIAMIKQIKFVLVMACFLCIACSQRKEANTVCDCSALIDPEFSKEIEVYEWPNGKLKQKIQSNHIDEDFIMLSMIGRQNGFYRVKASYSIAGQIVEGWIKQDIHIGVYARAYPVGDSLRLMSAPEKTSTANSLKIGYTTQLFEVIDCNSKGWLKVSILLNGKRLEGWIAPEDQCDNPYTTCN